jgi:hypothetical protein
MAARKLLVACGLAFAFSAPALLAQSAKAALPRTPDGHVDLQGIWDFRSATALERPARFAGREFMTADEVIAYEQEALEREDGRPPDDGRTEQSVHPVWWLDYGKTVVGSRRTSLIVDPADGKIPPLSAEGQRRSAERRAAARTHGPADSYENRSLQERCITRGLPEVTLPGPYNNNLQIVQTSAYVMLQTEMIHDARIVPMDGRPHNDPALRSWMGDSRGRWEGDTLVIDTTNFVEDHHWIHDRLGIPASDALHIVERIRMTNAGKQLEIEYTLTDPKTWEGDWKMVKHWNRVDDRDISEVECLPDLNQHMPTVHSSDNVR